MNKNKHYFAGANSGNGFVNCFGFINEDRAEGMLYILKGSPGSGKSTLMKRIAAYFEDMGIETERFYCSSDPDSLDGVRLPVINTAVVDGTAPHTLDCSMPGMKERIVDLGVYIGNGIKGRYSEAIKLINEKKTYFDKAYAYIGLAHNLRHIYSHTSQDMQKALEQADRILDGINVGDDGQYGTGARMLYLTAVGEKGIVDLSVLNGYQRIVKVTDNGQSSESLMNALRDRLLVSGHRITVFPDVLDKNIIDFIEISEKGILLARDKVNRLPVREAEIYDYYMAQAGEELSKAKSVHRELEKLYIANMNFDGLDSRTKSLTDEIAAQL